MACAYGIRLWWRKVAAFLVLATAASSAPTSGASAAAVKLLVLGDSLSAGYGVAHEDGFEARLADALRAHGHDVRIIDGAVSGDTTAGGRARLDWVLADGADAAIVELGANDGLRGVDPKVTEANLAAILDALSARHIPVLLSGMYALPNLGRDYADAFRAVFERLGARPGVIYDPFFLEGVAADSALNQPDGLHPNPGGVRRIVERILPLVERLLVQAKVPAG
jgi:acyl-CoA thioesterase-1